MKATILAFALVSLWPASSPAAVPTEVARIVKDSCVRCHDETNDLDLTTLPPETEKQTWLRVFEMVESSRMPPPAKSGSIEKRFPLDPAVRHQLLDGVSRILGAMIDVQPRVRHISNDVWLSILTEVASPIVAQDKLSPIIASAKGPWPPSEIPAVMQVKIDVTSQAVCDAMADAELTRAPKARTLLGALSGQTKSQPSAKEAQQLATALHRATFGVDPTGRELQERVALLSKVAKTSGRREGWLALCSAELSGPQLLYLSYAQE
jgi:hypothetical protein